ncbi:MAG: hypothetical protein HQK73_12240 [Desulfamplus sp.]|nr:hypothetical protein [Desulfamplus sp.]
MRDSLKETVQGLMDIGVSTKFTKDELNEIGVINSHVDITSNKIKNIRNSMKYSFYRSSKGLVSPTPKIISDDKRIL